MNLSLRMYVQNTFRRHEDVHQNRDLGSRMVNLVPRSHSGFLRTRLSPPLLCHSYKRNFPVVKVKIFPSVAIAFLRTGNVLPQDLPK